MRRQIIGRAIVLAAVAASTAACQHVAGRQTAADTGGWRRIDVPAVTQSPGDRRQEGGLAGVVAISPADVWTVGSRSAVDNVPLALHWDGARWTAFQPPAPRQNLDRLDYPASLVTVSASGPHDVWAAGDQAEPYVVHWTGADWTLVPLAPANTADRLTRIWDVAAVSPTDAWLAGQAGRGPDRPVIEHWDGARWSSAATPAVPTSLNGSRLRGLTAVSARDVWAVGDRDGLAETEHGCLIEHWDGNRWSLVACPVPANAATAWLAAATVLAPTDIWAVGGWTPRQVGTEMVKTRALVEHWDGVAWRVMPAPDLSGPLRTVAGRSDSYIVAAPTDQDGGVVRWDGARWQPVALTPVVTPGRVPFISGLTTAPDGRIWAVGRATDPGQTSRSPNREPSNEPLILANDP